MQLVVTRAPAARETADVAPVEGITRAEPAELALEELEPGLAVRGAYAPSEAAFAQLLDRWELGGKGLGRDRLAALLWSSYLVGMELPGKRALFWSLDLRFRDDVPGSTSFSYVATVDRADEQMEFVDVTADLTCGETPWAQAKVRAFVRRELPSPAPTARLSPGPGSDARRGTVAVVIGGSRGLGAALVQNLVMEGCTVLATYWQSADDAERLALGLSEAPGTVEFLQGDAGDEAWCRDVLGSRVAEHSRLDLLVCNAAPALRPLGLDPEGLERFQDFTTTSLRLVASPLAALIEPLSERSGTCVLVSSSALREPPADWPHYVTAKSAAEGLIGWAATKYPRVRFLVARPPRMRTAMTNSPGAHWNAVAAESVAHTILQQLSGPAGGGVELLETFVSPRATADG
jgi:NAD(P)-dependent dehydrogenase (short-subunit alcohol dehydrogenase family)